MVFFSVLHFRSFFLFSFLAISTASVCHSTFGWMVIVLVFQGHAYQEGINNNNNKKKKKKNNRFSFSVFSHSSIHYLGNEEYHL